MRRASRWCAVLAAALFLAACFGPRVSDRDPEMPDPTLITRPEIEASGARNAWDALRLLSGLRLVENVEGAPAGLFHRGRRSAAGFDTPLIVIDGAIHRDFRHLARMPVEDLASIRIRSTATAGAEYGALARRGVLEVTTRRP